MIVSRARRGRYWRAVAEWLPFVVAAWLVFVGAARIPYNVREHDIGSHLQYIRLVQETRRVPGPDDCWECHQPPLYYIVAATLLGATKSALPPEHPEAGVSYPGARWLQRLGIACGVATVFFWLVTIRMVVEKTYERLLASAFVTFWPTLAVHACRIGNDGLFYAFAAASLCLLVAWRRSGRTLPVVGAALAAGLAAETKANGTVVLLVVASSLAASALRPHSGVSRWSRGLVFGTAAVLLAAASWALSVVLWKHGKTTTNFHSMGDNLIVQNTWRSFVTIHTGSFYPDPFEHWSGSDRDEVWNVLLRTSLFGQWSSANPTTRVAAYRLVVLAALFVPPVVAGLVTCVLRGLRRDDGGHRELAITFLGFVAFLLLLRHTYPWLPHNDFRFILPIVAPAAVMAATSLGWLRRRLRRRWPHLAAIPAWLVAAFCILSVQIVVSWP